MYPLSTLLIFYLILSFWIFLLIAPMRVRSLISRASRLLIGCLGFCKRHSIGWILQKFQETNIRLNWSWEKYKEELKHWSWIPKCSEQIALNHASLKSYLKWVIHVLFFFVYLFSCDLWNFEKKYKETEHPLQILIFVIFKSVFI